MSEAAPDPRIAAAAAALPADAGDPAAFRYEAEFESLDAAIRQAEREGPSQVDWARLSHDAQQVLATRSKDLLVACWFAYAAMRVEGLPGLAAGLGAVAAMSEAHWDTMYPPVARARARMQAIEWFATRTAPLVPQALPPGQGPAAIAALGGADALQALLDEKLAPSQASIGDLLRALRPLAEEAERAAAPPAPAPVEAPKGAPPAPAPTASRAPTPLPAAPVVVAVPSGANTEQALSVLREAVRGAALRLVETDPLEPRAYAMLRAATWLHIADPPPATAGKTPIMRPPETQLTEFEAMRTAGNWGELSISLEKFLSGSGIFWLDGQRLAHEALLGQGMTFAPAAREVARGVGLLLARMPSLLDLAFEDGSPFADSATRSWVQRETMAAGADDGAGAATEPWTAGIESARALVAEGQAEQAVGLLTAGAAGAAGGRARLRWRLALGRLLLEAGHAAVALPIAQACMDAAQPMVDWEPEAAAEAARLLQACLATREAAGLLDPQALAQSRRLAHSVIAVLDPVRTMRAGVAEII